MRHASLILSVLIPSLLLAQSPTPELALQVRAAESTFAASLANRDIAAFAALVAEDAIFYGQEGATRGRAAVVESWRPLFQGEKAPFSWKPGTVEVLSSGTLALSSGPVYDASGKQFGNFNSVWRKTPKGTWEVVFDKGCPACQCPPKP